MVFSGFLPNFYAFFYEFNAIFLHFFEKKSMFLSILVQKPEETAKKPLTFGFLTPILRVFRVNRVSLQNHLFGTFLEIVTTFFRFCAILRKHSGPPLQIFGAIDPKIS